MPDYSANDEMQAIAKRVGLEVGKDATIIMEALDRAEQAGRATFVPLGDEEVEELVGCWVKSLTKKARKKLSEHDEEALRCLLFGEGLYKRDKRDRRTQT
jgi:hypothetical protein